MRYGYRPGAFALLALMAFGCESTGPVEPTSEAFADRQFIINPDGSATVSPEEIDLCKVGPAGSYSFSVSAPAGALPAGGSPNVNAGSCVQVLFKGGAAVTATIAENVPAGFVLDSIVVEQLAGTTVTRSVTTLGNSVTAVASGFGREGAVVTFFNSVEPPPEGGEGCTPGYWKQSHHFDSWPAPYTPTTPFGSVFANAFPGMTLVQVAAQGGGGLKALGRHTVAALLNAASSGVSYDLTVANVISAFNAAYASGSYEAQKNIFEGFNQQGCPLN